MLQLSEDWFKARLGRFTASNIVSLMGVKGLGKTGETYIREKAIDTFLDYREETYTNEDMQRGIDQEDRARELFSIENFLEVEEATFFPYGLHAGASPDGLIGKEEVLEIKCPKRNNFFKVKLDNYIDPKYMAQMQMQMLCTNSKKCYYYNYFLDEKGVEHTHTIEVLRDEKYIEKLKTRLEEAIILKETILKQLQ